MAHDLVVKNGVFTHSSLPIKDFQKVYALSTTKIRIVYDHGTVDIIPGNDGLTLNGVDISGLSQATIIQKITQFFSIGNSKSIPFATAIPFDTDNAVMTPLTISALVTFTADLTNAVPGYKTILRATADGNAGHIPSLAAFKNATGAWNNTNGKVNLLIFLYDGTDVSVQIYPLT